jgi:hypothetical protein
LTQRINNDGVDSDIILRFDANKFTQNSYNIIQQLSTILESNEIEAGTFELDIFEITINKVKTYENSLIRLN